MFITEISRELPGGVGFGRGWGGGGEGRLKSKTSRWKIYGHAHSDCFVVSKVLKRNTLSSVCHFPRFVHSERLHATLPVEKSDVTYLEHFRMK